MSPIDSGGVFINGPESNEWETIGGDRRDEIGEYSVSRTRATNHVVHSF